MATREGFVVINGVETKVVTHGAWIEDALPGKHVIICIPGNPGITGFYRTFLRELHAKLDTPVWIVSHAGHELPSRSREKLKSNLHNYNVHGQTEHKVAFIKKYVPKDVRITLIGHSIGCKIILNALKSSEIAKQVNKSYLLFPTIERMAVTPNGKFLIGTIKPFVFLICYASWLFHILPRFLKTILVNIWFMFDGTPTEMTDVAIKLVQPKILRNVFYMAYDEMDTVTDLDTEAIERFGDRLVLYYGMRDNWAPMEYCVQLKRAFPRVDIHACEKGYDHAFVLSQSVGVGLMVAGWIQNDRENGSES